MSDINKEVGLNIRKIREDERISKDKMDVISNIQGK